LHILIKYILLCICKKSGKSERVRWGTFSKLVDFIWNDPKGRRRITYQIVFRLLGKFGVKSMFTERLQSMSREIGQWKMIIARYLTVLQ